MKGFLSNKWLRVVLGFMLTVSMATASACNTTNTPPASGSPTAKDTLQGKIAISGAFALYPMMQKWAEEFQTLHPNVQIDISAGGAGKGATDALGKLVDIGMISRDITQSEIDNGGFYVTSVKGAVVPVVNANNPFAKELQTRGITHDEFVGIWVTGKITDWKSLFPNSTVTGNTAIKIYNRSDACGAGDTWAKYLGKKQEDLLGIGINSDPGITEAVAKDTMGTGYNNIGYGYDQTTGKVVSGVNITPIDINANGKIDPDEAFYDTRDRIVSAIGTEKYPPILANDLNLLTYKEFKGVTYEFVKWIMTDGQKYVLEAGYVPLTKVRLDAQLTKLGLK